MEALGNQILTELFKTDTEKAIEIATHLIVNQPNVDFETWAEEEKNRVTEFSCHESWESSHVVVVCQTCAIGKNSGICVPCYLKGNHEGHSLLIDISNSGACDCGNSSCWNPKGFCKKHIHEVPDNPHIIDLGEKRSDFIGSIVLSAISALIPLSFNHKTVDNVELICRFLINLALIGDAYRRIISLVFVDDYDFNDLLINWPRFNFEAANSIFKLLSELINDSVFINRFTTYFCDSFTYLIGVKVNTAFHEDSYYESELYFDETLPVDILLDISFYTWSYLSSHPSLFEFNNIPDLISRTLTIYTSLMGYNQRHQIVSSECMRSLLEYLGILINTEYFLNLLSDPDNQEILSSFLRSISLVEANPIIEITDNPKSTVLKNYCKIHHLLYTTFKPIVKVNVDSSIFFSVLSFYVLMNLIRDLVDHPADTTTSIWQRSIFSRGICMGCFLPLHYLSFEHFIMHTNDPVHDWESIANSQNMEPEILLFGTTVLPIRSCAVASYMSFGLSPAPKAINSNLNHEQALRGRYAAVYCAAALLSEPDDFISMIMHTYGLFDDPDPIIHQTLILQRFSFLHLLTVILFDSSIFERTYRGILRSQTISLLQYGPMPISNILEALQSYEGNLEFSYELKSVLDEISYKVKQKDKIEKEEEDRPKRKSSKSKNQDFSKDQNKLPSNFKTKKQKNLSSIFSDNNSNSSSSSASSSSSSSSSSFESDIPDFALTPPPPSLYILKPQYKTVAPFNIWTSPSFTYSVIRSLIDPEMTNVLDLNLHRQKPFPNGFDTNKILFSQCFYSACYMTALYIEFRTDYTTAHLMLNLLLYADKINDEPPCKEFQALIKVQTFKQLCMIMPSSFQRFLRTPFQFKYHPPSTFLDLVRHFGPVGQNFINTLTKNNNNTNTNTNNKKKNVDSIKLMEINEINRQISNYLPKIVKIELHQQCAICHKTTKVTELIPALLYKFKMMPSGRITLRVTLNGSIFHSKCFFESKESMIYSNFVLNDTNSVTKAFNSDLTKLIQTISDEIEILEIRLSRNPFIFRDSAPILKLTYLFEAAKVIAKKEKTAKNGSKNGQGQQSISHMKVETDFLSKLVSDLTFSKNAKESFFELFEENYANEYGNDKKIEFSMLRRCALVASNIAHVISSEQTEAIINSYTKLCDLFKITNRITKIKSKTENTNNNSSNTSNTTNDDNDDTAKSKSAIPATNVSSNETPKETNTNENDSKTSTNNTKKSSTNEDESKTSTNNTKRINTNEDESKTSTNNTKKSSTNEDESKTSTNNTKKSSTNEDESKTSTNNSKKSNTNENESKTSTNNTRKSNTNEDISNSNDDDDVKSDKNSSIKNDDGEEDEMTLTYYPFISLPKNFLEFCDEPYSYDILNISCNDSHQYLCLLTGECLETDDVLDHLKEVGYSIFLILTGCMAGAVCVMLDGHPELTRTVESPYVTIFGEEQFGMKDGQMLWFNEDRMWRLCDQFLDGTLLLPDNQY